MHSKPSLQANLAEPCRIICSPVPEQVAAKLLFMVYQYSNCECIKYERL